MQKIPARCYAFIFCFSVAIFLFARPAAATKVYLKGGDIIVETEDGVRTIDYRRDNKYEYTHLDKWVVYDERDPVQEALKVFKRKGGDAYSRKIWIFNKRNGSQRMVVEYSTIPSSDKILFSPDEKYFYYLGLDGSGHTVLYSVDLSTQSTSMIGAATEFELLECGRNDEAYIVVQQNGGNRYSVYTLDGRREDIVGGVIGLPDLKRFVCY